MSDTQGISVHVQGLYHGTPMIVIPLYAEQPWHASQVQHLGNGIGLKIPSPITAEVLGQSLSAAFSKILGTDDYLVKAQQISQRMRAERWTPVQKAASEPLLASVMLCLYASQAAICHVITHA